MIYKGGGGEKGESPVILCQEVRELYYLYIYIYIFLCCCFFLDPVVLSSVVLSNTNNLHIIIWFQVFLSNANNYKN